MPRPGGAAGRQGTWLAPSGAGLRRIARNPEPTRTTMTSLSTSQDSHGMPDGASQGEEFTDDPARDRPDGIDKKGAMGRMRVRLSPTITNMIRLDHTHVLSTFHQYKPSAALRVKKGLAGTICTAL